jgi:Fic family protein
VVLRELLSNMDQFQNDDTDALDPLIRMAILHYQFEAIHPFPDGNGRTGRILNVVYLVQSGLLELPTLYLSRHILKTRGEYYSALERVTSHGDWERWIVYILTAAEMTSKWTTGKIGAIRRLQLETNDYVRTQLPKIYSRELVDLIFTQPYSRISNVVDRGIAKRQAASTYLKELVKIGVLREEKIGREKVFLHKKYFDLLIEDQHQFEPYGKKSKPAAFTGVGANDGGQ